MAGFFDGLYESTQNPLFLGGLGLMSGGTEGMMQGMNTGNQFLDRIKKQKLQDQRQQAMQSGLASMQGLSDSDRQLLGADPELAQNALSKMFANKFDPNADLNRQTAEANLARTRAQTQQLQNTPAGGETPANIREWQVFQRMTPEDQQRYMTMRRGPKYLDTGTEFVLPDSVRPGQNVNVVPKNIAEAEQQKVVGKESGELQMMLPKAQSALAAANAKTDNVLRHIQRAKPMISHLTAGIGSMLSNVPGTAAKDLKELKATIIANLGFSELQEMRNNSPTGGALGAIAVQELEMLQKTVTSIEQAQSPEQLRSAFETLERELQGSTVRRGRAFDMTYGPSQSRGGYMDRLAPPQQQPPQPTTQAPAGWSHRRLP